MASNHYRGFFNTDNFTIHKLNQKQMSELINVKGFFSRDDVKEKFKDLLGKKAQGFITSVLQAVNSNDMLSKADPHSVYNSAAVAATLDLPINNSLGFAYIVPYNQKQKDGTWKVVAQFQIGYKGFIQLAQRSGQFKTISATPIYEGQLVEENPLTGFSFDFKQKKSDTIIGFASYFSLINGFEKTLYMTVEELKQHGVRFSQTAKKGYGLWKDDFNSMAQKTVLKLLLSKFAPLSIEMQKAVITDQSLILDADATDVTYIDNTPVDIDKEAERVQLMLENCSTPDEVDALQEQMPDVDVEKFNQRKSELKGELV